MPNRSGILVLLLSDPGPAPRGAWSCSSGLYGCLSLVRCVGNEWGERRGVRHLTLRLESKSPRPEPFQPGAGIRQGPGSDADLPPPMGRIDFGLRLESDIQFRPEVGSRHAISTGGLLTSSHQSFATLALCLLFPKYLISFCT